MGRSDDGAAHQMGSMRSSLLLDMQKSLYVYDALAGVDATHEVGERGIVDREYVTKNVSRYCID